MNFFFPCFNRFLINFLRLRVFQEFKRQFIEAVAMSQFGFFLGRTVSSIVRSKFPFPRFDPYLINSYKAKSSRGVHEPWFVPGESKKFTRMVGCGVKSMRPIFKTEVLFYRVSQNTPDV